MATRAASIWREVMKPQVSACRPKSPNSTRVAPLETPRIFPFWDFRNFTFFGASIAVSSCQPGVALLEHLALEDPALHADGPVGRVGLGGAVFDVGPQGMQGHPALAVPLVASHLGPAQTTGAGEANAL